MWSTGGEVAKSAWHGGDQGLRAAGWGARRWVHARVLVDFEPSATSKTDRASANAKMADTNVTGTLDFHHMMPPPPPVSARVFGTRARPFPPGGQANLLPFASWSCPLFLHDSSKFTLLKAKSELRHGTATHKKWATVWLGTAAIDSAPVTHAQFSWLQTAAQVFGPLRVRCRLAHAMEDLRHGTGCGAERGCLRSDRSGAAGPLYLIKGACEGVPVSGPLPLVSRSTARAKVDSAQYSINGRVDL